MQSFYVQNWSVCPEVIEGFFKRLQEALKIFGIHQILRNRLIQFSKEIFKHLQAASNTTKKILMEYRSQKIDDDL